MKKVYTLLAATLLTGATAFGVPAKKEYRTFKQIDGSEITLSLTGDEYLHYYITTDGVPVQKAQDGSFRYVQSFTDRAVLSEVIARNPEERTSNDRIYVAQLMESDIFSQASETRAMRVQAKNIEKAAAFPNHGTVTGLLLLVEFQDLEFTIANPKETFEARLNTENFQDDQCYGSVYDYFNSQSHGKFNMKFDVFGPVKVKGNMVAYGGNSAMGSDKDVPRMIKEACEALDDEIDFTKYDTDGDGVLDLVFAVYAGHGEAQGAPANTIWPHKYDVRYGGYNVQLDGITIGPYACSCELSGAYGSNIDGIGTICHEFSHCLGLADVYDTDGTAGGSGWGLGDFCIMDSGSYNDDSFTPCGYTAFEKMSLGWLTPTELKHTIFGAQLKNIAENDEAYIIYSDVNEDEYYMLENRQQIGWDKYIPAHGLLISHIDYDESVWNGNVVNNVLGKEHFHIVPADNKSSYVNQTNDLYPGRLIKNTEFTDDSQPAATLRTGGFLGKPVTNIKETDDIITFDFMADRIAAPVALAATNVTTTSFTANWEEVESNEHYTLTVSPLVSTDPTSEIKKETFSKFTEGTPESPDNSDISQELDTYMETTGWSGSKVYQAGGMCRIGLSLTKGYLATPDMTLPAKFTVTFTAKDYVSAAGKEDGGIIYVGHCAYKDGQSEFLRKETIELTPEERTYSFTFENGGEKQFIEFGNESKRVLIDNIRITSAGSEIPEVKVFENITGSSYEVTGLVPNYIYHYTVKAYRGDLVSEESNVIEVETKLGLAETADDNTASVITRENGIEIINAEGKNVVIYTIDGKLVDTFAAASNSEFVSLNNGLYIVRVNDKAFKIIF